MSYQGPIEVIASQMRITSEIHLGEEIVKAVQKVGVNVDKAELLKALRYDREQYQKGYKDRENDIVTCRNCRKRYGNGCKFYMAMIETDGDFYCKDGERE